MSTILKKLRNKISNSLYLQIWENRIRASVINSDETYDEKPLVAIELKPNGQKIIQAIGNNAELSIAQNITIVNPFSHPRSLIKDFQVGEKLLQHVFKELHKKSFLKAAPDVIFHPMEKIEGGLTQIELRAFREMIFGAGAFEVYLHLGSPLITRGANFSNLTNSMDKIL